MNTTRNISDILDISELWRLIEAKRIKLTEHPTLPIDILNYTDLATYAGEWTQAERVCRGLIVERGTGKVIARGPSKFFNYGEPSAKTYPLDTMVRVTRKEDGSLGVGWCYDDVEADTYHWGYSTRGSFTSEQAVHATAMVNGGRAYGLYEIACDSLPQYLANSKTHIAEIVYPANRIVLDYGDTDELISLGSVDNFTGLIEARPSVAYTRVPERIMTLAEAIALPIPDDEEGYVLDILDAEGSAIDHLKLKGVRYKELHAAIFGLTERKVWDAMVAGTTHEFIVALPDEVQPWAFVVKERLATDFSALAAEIDRAWRFTYILPTRKEQAAKVMSEYKHLSGALFAELDNNGDKAVSWIHNQIKPGHVPFQSVKENA